MQKLCPPKLRSLGPAPQKPPGHDARSLPFNGVSLAFFSPASLASIDRCQAGLRLWNGSSPLNRSLNVFKAGVGRGQFFPGRQLLGNRASLWSCCLLTETGDLGRREREAAAGMDIQAWLCRGTGSLLRSCPGTIATQLQASKEGLVAAQPDHPLQGCGESFHLFGLARISGCPTMLALHFCKRSPHTNSTGCVCAC